jgi:hypothetical protein
MIARFLGGGYRLGKDTMTGKAASLSVRREAGDAPEAPHMRVINVRLY